ncbi:MAG: hypothetical protein M1833_001401 [Piccolia ochrophora]|nr:MAG: hypothetical protein M1833_001401 [Piccolia ochrophora]
MSSVGRITSSLLSAVSENAFGLANFNFDFSLIKFEAPPEFQAVGSALSTQRRADAEDGPLHKTVRRLGGLFEQITPSTPKLIKAYGLRASEIIQTAGINPQGSAEDGPFQAFVGADGTSIWAAATSGPASLGIHLLSCMLARQFDDVKVATSIWVEIIAERQKEIEAACEANHIVSPSSVMAARQEIRRDDLALLDASARSWLRSADQVKLSEQKKLMLIVKNINVSVSGGTSTYSKVMGAWRQAMTGLENLLSEMPQEVSDGAILLALSSWHLYPDMVVLSNTTVNVKYDDPILPAGGIVTVGLRATDSSDEAGIRWSLALSHLRYYGDPVQIHSDTDNSRIDMDQLCLVALGALLFSWHVAPHDTENAALWFRALWKSIGGEDPTQQKTMAHRLGWLKILVNASYSVLEPDNEHALMLVSFGRRRGKSFLSELASQCRPFFGLCNPFITNALAASCDSECGLRYLRGIADFSGLRSDETVIRYIAEDGCGNELQTVVPKSKMCILGGFKPQCCRDQDIKKDVRVKHTATTTARVKALASSVASLVM